MSDISTSRINYSQNLLDKVLDCPFEQFENWLEDAYDTDEILEPNAMTLCTVNSKSKPSARIVLLRGFSENSFEFYTNYESKKGKDLDENKNAALCFYWDKLERQVRIEGEVEKLSPEKSDRYFDLRPRGSKVSATISKQSETVLSREELENNFKNLEQSNKKLTRPEHWGGYLLIPNKIEFWQGRPSRLHDRFLYEFCEENETWDNKRLYP